MRRTEQEFKAEVLRRSEHYRRERARKRRNLLGTGLCVCLCFALLAVFAPMGGTSSDNAAAADMAGLGDLKTESAVAQQDGGTASRFPQETYIEYCFGGAAPEEDEAAPMEQEAPAAEPEEEPMPGMATEGAENSGVSRRYNVVSIEVKTNPEDEEYHRFFTDVEKVASIIIAIERFYPVDESLQEPEPTEGMAYEIVVTYEDETETYTFFGDGLYSDSDGWIRFDANAARKLKETLAQESDAVPDVSVSKANAANSWPLSPADAQKIIGRLSGDWIPSAANCLCDYTLYVNGETYRYHSDCGTVQDESGQSLILSEADKQIVNEILESYMN